LRTFFPKCFASPPIFLCREDAYIDHIPQPLTESDIMSKLHTSIQIGPHKIAHRVVLAPLTRMRAEPGAVPGKLMAEYYAQRTSEGGFLIGEATIAAPNGNG
jgi:hypothetical protein